MAFLTNALLAAAVLASHTKAIPMVVNQRDVVVNTVTETTWTTIDITTTIWVNDANPTGAARVEAPLAPDAQATAADAPPAPPSPAAISPSAGGVFAEVSSQTSSAAPVYTPEAASAATPSRASSDGRSVDGICSSSSPCSGDITWYEGGPLGACGWPVNTESDMVIAIPASMMGDASNNSPYCGAGVTIIGTDGSPVQATVSDKCMGCVGQSIDLTDVLFKKVAPNGDGRVHNIQWYFN